MTLLRRAPPVAKARARRGHPEHAEQVRFFARVDRHACTNELPIYAVPNAGRRSPRQGAWMKAEGLRAGVPDVMVCVKGRLGCGLAVEFKVKGGRLTPAQKHWHGLLTRHGWGVVVAYSAEQAWEFLAHHLGITTHEPTDAPMRHLS